MIERTRKSLKKMKRRRVKIKTLLLLSLTLVFNTYAWFLYKTTVSGNVTVHVSAWSVEFAVDDENITKELVINVAEAYPGMEDVNKTVSIHNSGDKEVDLDVEITGLRILNTTYTISETGEPGTYTSAQIKKLLAEDLPFHVEIQQPDEYLGLDADTSVNVSFTWDYDENASEDDTEYGVAAYQFYNDVNYNNQPAISIVILINASQHQSEP